MAVLHRTLALDPVEEMGPGDGQMDDAPVDRLGVPVPVLGPETRVTGRRGVRQLLEDLSGGQAEGVPVVAVVEVLGSYDVAGRLRPYLRAPLEGHQGLRVDHARIAVLTREADRLGQ